jgi:hypothetical protein
VSFNPASENLFNDRPTVSVVPLSTQAHCLVIDNALQNPAAMRAFAETRAEFSAPHYPYPGLVAAVDPVLHDAMGSYFDRLARDRLGARRRGETLIRLSRLESPVSALVPMQWLCHRDRVAADPARTLFAASVLYLFDAPDLGGTDFYRSRLSPADTDQLVADSQRLDAEAFTRRYGVPQGYMTPGQAEAYFEHVAYVPAAWNRLICYDGGLFHSARVALSPELPAQPAPGRITLNGFYTCTRRLV